MILSAFFPGVSTRDGLPQALDWLVQCQTKHATCAADTDTHWKPKRLLRCADGLVRVLDTTSERPRGPYAILSHRWGSNPNFIVLTADNTSAFSKGVSLCSLLQNFRDVLDIVQQLGIVYLWIDSLCILHSEIASVYTNCLVNIATHNPSTPKDSAFSTPRKNQDLRRDPSIMWHGFCTTSKLYSLYDWTLNGHGALRSSRLSTRAWVFQECLLSPRILHVGSSQMFWECNELALASECYPLGIPDKVRHAYGHRPFNISARELRPRRDADGHNTRPEPYDDAWKWMIGEYASCQLTYSPKDKQVALAGITRKLAELWHDD
ncbi:hypothetical protein EJ02DRAFT_491191 [Clathrospora elynae]|uniref:Heterokaryon incompatibility domain-containing protein n=1 Tax=Clathrospora elynae TaxID=706981 RepID=A0A6A5SQG6_9PLEO|nr:hypothetical protein EJ02DRAFT_491191 [Clathrospora elynae]